jgi:hypothetical protein
VNQEHRVFLGLFTLSGRRWTLESRERERSICENDEVMIMQQHGIKKDQKLNEKHVKTILLWIVTTLSAVVVLFFAVFVIMQVMQFLTVALD